ncbi:UDP binding domain-containing protein [Sphingosinicella sp.]|jgi:UDP-N-acetyl-D-galactosamine dehydrogenase|uniref:UDP binding domain-containing protein n=1 Tax=Sphingosinicella sp. TaxID=1917971 RepID=UPI0035AD9173
MAQKLGHDPQVVLAGRAVNDTMGLYIAGQVHAWLGRVGKILVLGVTFKEDVPDLGNSKVVDIIGRLQWIGHDVTVHDPLADAAEADHEYGFLLDDNAFSYRYDAVIAAVAHAFYKAVEPYVVVELLNENGLVVDIKGVCREQHFPAYVCRLQI